MKIQPIEDFVFDGLRKRLSTVFQCPCIYSTSNDEVKALEQFFAGKPVQYPYMFVSINTLASNNESYATNRIARKGLPVVIDDGGEQLHTVRVLPTNFECEVKFVTNKFKGGIGEQDNILAFARRWLFARRCGYLKFNVRYGNLDLRVGATLSDSVPIPKLENKVEQESAYPPVTGTITLHGYISEPELGTTGVVNKVEVDVVLDEARSVPGSQFFSFNRE